ncbi:hypothetical protein ACFSJ3_03970 [Corallincola platygyrae]|uniref:Uncharacterized protein n=1 Tax=Corallincola platygyrae TaxID=1193278 RepID=A0ABW4XK29_9GAMM
MPVSKFITVGALFIGTLVALVGKLWIFLPFYVLAVFAAWGQSYFWSAMGGVVTVSSFSYFYYFNDHPFFLFTALIGAVLTGFYDLFYGSGVIFDFIRFWSKTDRDPFF